MFIVIMHCFYFTFQDSSVEPTVICEGTYGRIVGALRTTKGQKYIIIFKSEPVTDLNELTCHVLEVLQTATKLKKLRAAEEQKPAQGAGLDNTFSNSMLTGPTGAGFGGGMPAGGGLPGFTANQNMVHRIISSVKDESGISKDSIIAAVKNQIPIKEIQ